MHIPRTLRRQSPCGHPPCPAAAARPAPAHGGASRRDTLAGESQLGQRPSGRGKTARVRRGFEHTIEIDATADRVWDALANFDDYPAWNPFMRQVSGSARVGERLRITLSPPRGRRIVVAPRVVCATPGRQLGWAGRLPFGLFSGEHTYLIEAAAHRGVRVTHRGAYRGLLVGLLGRVIDHTSVGFEVMHRALKQHVETPPAAPHAASAEADLVGVAAELRDEMLQTLTALRLTVDRLLGAWSRGDQRAARQTAEQAVMMIDDVVARTRRLAFSLVPPSLAEHGLDGGLAALPAAVGFPAGVVTIRVLALRRFPAAIELACCRAVEIALRRARGAQAGRVVVVVRDDGDTVDVSVTDDGPAADRAASRRGLDLVEELVSAVGGEVQIAADAAATRIRFRVPLPVDS